MVNTTNTSAMEHQIKEQSIAFAGLWQAANLVYELAHNQELDRQQTRRFQCSARSVLALEADTAAEVYGTVDNLRFSILGLHSFLGRKHSSPPNVMLYMMQILRLQKKLTNNPKMSMYIAEELSVLKLQQDFYQGQEPALVANLGRIYSETFGRLPMRQRIKVQGIGEILQKPEVQSGVRTMLFAGVRAAMLWRQMDGNRLQLLLRRHSYEKALASLVDH